jgi:hypothetical protein
VDVFEYDCIVVQFVYQRIIEKVLHVIPEHFRYSSECTHNNTEVSST